MESATAKVTKPFPVPCSEKSKPPSCSVRQALIYKCTECSHQGEQEDHVIKHIKNKQRAILSPAKVKNRFHPLGRNPNIHLQQTNLIALCVATYIFLRPMLPDSQNIFIQKHVRLAMQNCLVKQKEITTLLLLTKN